MYCEGENVEENHEEAFKWFKKSAEQGGQDAIDTLKSIKDEQARLGNTNNLDV